VLPLQPVQSGEREPALDVLRGFALFGVLIAYALWNLGSPVEETYGPRLGWGCQASLSTQYDMMILPKVTRCHKRDARSL
jgi:uncharacterized membrane protein YeiB